MWTIAGSSNVAGRLVPNMRFRRQGACAGTRRAVESAGVQLDIQLGPDLSMLSQTTRGLARLVTSRFDKRYQPECRVKVRLSSDQHYACCHVGVNHADTIEDVVRNSF